MQDFFSGRSSGGSGAPNPQGSGSFSAFFSKIAGTAAALSVAALFFETSPEIKELAKTVLKYSVVTWGIFVLLPYIFQLIIRAPGEAKSRTTSILKTLLVAVAFPYVIRMLWQHRTTWKEGLNKIIREKLGLPAISSPPVIGLVPSEAGATATPPVGPTVPVGLEVLPAPLNMLPPNPSPYAQTHINEANAGERLSTAMQMAGFPVEGDVDIISIENGPTLQTISFRLPLKIQLSALIKKRDDLGNHFGHQKGFDIVSTEHQSSAAFVIPNNKRADVYVSDVARGFVEFSKHAELPMIIGKDIRGNPKFADIAKFPHLLVAGATGGGKSVGLNTGVSSLVSVRSPAEVRLLLIDPKRVELSVYNGLPHLIEPPITDFQRVPIALNKVIAEMEKRYEILEKAGVRNVKQYNKKMKDSGGKPLPYYVVVIDEYGDLMLVIGGDMEDAVTRLGQKARAAGIHIILTTQRPSVDVVTGVIKANLPSRMSFQMTSTQDFMTVMDTTGPKLLGRGDGMFMMNGAAMERFQSATIGSEEQSVTYVEDLVTYWKGQSRVQPPTVNLNKPGITPPVQLSGEGQLSLAFPELSAEDEPSSIIPLAEDEEQAARDEEIYRTAIEWAKNPEIVFSVSLLQRRCRIGYSCAARIVDRMEKEGLIGPYEAQRPGRQWLGGDTQPVSVTAEDPPPWDEQAFKPAPLLDEYARFCQVIKENGGFSMSIVQEQLSMDGETASRHVQRMIGEGLLGEFDSNLKKRPYLDPDQDDRKDAELLDRMKVYMCRTGSAKTSELRDIFQMRKEDILNLCKQLVEEGFLNDYTSKREGYTLAWTPEQREQFLKDRGAEEEEE
ncbi:FtsK/SpoIIIE domain-containing protein [Paenibacillus polymyxa]|uniref:FtsK/SpoIIIE domain-containing protein n=1 Tax=Paenibacillus polymyxa TaxID=1406 RepID=UPI0011188E1F|nr:FtsK/SpoIIIE domain-containing protein [Paenibacillus polymyxa]QDA30218.1 DNA translocase FtsK [Paenibacillus polymyxa]